ncbi:MAG: MFS transporter, partial [Thiohalospira sp.]
FAAMVPFIIIAEKQRRMRAVFLGAIAAVAVAAAGLGLAGQAGTLAGVALALLVYFTAFNLLEASLPSLIAKAAPAGAKGTAMGVYSSAQFLGAFTGGVAGGWAHGAAGAEGVFGLIAGAAAVWWLLARGMAPPHYLSSHVVAIPADADPAALTPRLAAVAGVAEVEVVPEEGAAYLKVELDRLDREGLAAATGQPSTA